MKSNDVMWLPALSNYNQNVLVLNYNEQSTLENSCDSRSCKTLFIDSSSGNETANHISSDSCSSTSSNTSYKQPITNCPKTMSTIKNVQSNENKPIEESHQQTESQFNENNNLTESTVVEQDQSADEIEIKPDEKAEQCRTNCGSNKNKSSDSESGIESHNSQDSKVDKLVNKLVELNRDVDANNNVCDKSPITDEKLESIGKSDGKSFKNKENEIIPANTYNNNKSQQCAVPTSYHLYYANGCAVPTSSNSHSTNKRISNKKTGQPNDLGHCVLNNTSPSTYSQHALNHHSAHLSSGTPYTIYTTGHYSLNGQPAILSIPPNPTHMGHLHQSANQSAMQSNLIGSSQPSQTPLMNQNAINQSSHTHHLHHNHYHPNQSHNSNHFHHYHQQAVNIQQNYHPNFNQQNSFSQQNNQKNLIKNGNSIKSLSSSVSASSLNSSTTVSNSPANNANLINTKSPIINSTTYTNSNSPSSPTASNQTASSTNSNQINQQQQQTNRNKTLANEPIQTMQSTVQPSSYHYHTGYYNAIFANKDTSSYTYRKIFVGGLPYHSTDKTLSKFFQTFGEIEEAVVITDRQSGRSKGYGFVDRPAALDCERYSLAATVSFKRVKRNVSPDRVCAYSFDPLSRESVEASEAEEVVWQKSTGSSAIFCDGPSENCLLRRLSFPDYTLSWHKIYDVQRKKFFVQSSYVIHDPPRNINVTKEVFYHSEDFFELAKQGKPIQLAYACYGDPYASRRIAKDPLASYLDANRQKILLSGGLLSNMTTTLIPMSSLVLTMDRKVEMQIPSETLVKSKLLRYEMASRKIRQMLEDLLIIEKEIGDQIARLDEDPDIVEVNSSAVSTLCKKWLQTKEEIETTYKQRNSLLSNSSVSHNASIITMTQDLKTACARAFIVKLKANAIESVNLVNNDLIQLQLLTLLGVHYSMNRSDYYNIESRIELFKNLPFSQSVRLQIFEANKIKHLAQIELQRLNLKVANLQKTIVKKNSDLDWLHEQIKSAQNEISRSQAVTTQFEELEEELKSNSTALTVRLKNLAEQIAEKLRTVKLTPEPLGWFTKNTFKSLVTDVTSAEAAEIEFQNKKMEQINSVLEELFGNISTVQNTTQEYEKLLVQSQNTLNVLRDQLLVNETQIQNLFILDLKEQIRNVTAEWEAKYQRVIISKRSVEDQLEVYTKGLEINLTENSFIMLDQKILKLELRVNETEMKNRERREASDKLGSNMREYCETINHNIAHIADSLEAESDRWSLAPTAYMYSNGLLLSQAPTMITGYPTNAACAYFDYTSFADPTHLTATISSINGPAYAAQTGGPMNHTQATNNGQYSSPDGTLFAPISTDLTTCQMYSFAPIQHRF